MTLEQLRIFVAVAEGQHLTRAARALNLAQSAVSHTVAALESEFKLRLFHRVGRGIELTEAGQIFANEARAVLAHAANARTTMCELSEPGRGTLSLHASRTIAGYWLPSRLQTFHRRFPLVRMRLDIGNTEQVARSIHDGHAEIGFVEGAIDDPELEVMAVAQDQLILVVSPDHEWTDGRPVRPAMLAGIEWVVREPGSGTRAEFERALLTFDVSPAALQIVLELPSNEAVRAAAEAGMGAAVLSASVAAPSIEAGLLHHVPFTVPARHFAVVHHRKRYLGHSARALIALVTAQAGLAADRSVLDRAVSV